MTYLLLMVALDKDPRLREVKKYAPGHTAQYVAEGGVKPGLSRVTSVHSVNMKILKISSARAPL